MRSSSQPIIPVRPELERLAEYLPGESLEAL
jgi:hypothetical protein